MVDWVVLSGGDARAREAERSADAFLAGVATRRLTVERFRDGFLPYQGERVKDYFETLKTRVEPDVVFTPYRGTGTRTTGSSPSSPGARSGTT